MALVHASCSATCTSSTSRASSRTRRASSATARSAARTRFRTLASDGRSRTIGSPTWLIGASCALPHGPGREREPDGPGAGEPPPRSCRRGVLRPGAARSDPLADERLALLAQQADPVLLDLAVERRLAELQPFGGLRDVPPADAQGARDLALLDLGERQD